MGFAGFILESVRHPKQTGSFVGSSRFLAKKMVQEMDGTVDVIEFGPGAGSVTREILRRLPENGRLTCFEINSKFCRHLETIKDSRLKIINDDARNCGQYIDSFDCIVSGLPLGLFGRLQRETIIALSSKSKTYIQFQYTPFLRRKMKHYFEDVKLKFVLLNFPPAFIYVCRGSVK